MLNSSSFVLWASFVCAGYFQDVISASYLQDFSSWDQTSHRPTIGEKTFSEERLERKEAGLFRRTTNHYPHESQMRNPWQKSTSETTFTTSPRPYPDPVPSKKTLCEPERSSSSSEEYLGNVIYLPTIGSTRKPSIRDQLGSRQKKEESKTKKWCKEYEKGCLSRKGRAKSTDLEMRITGGRMADPKQNTFMVLIGYGGTKSDRQWLCGGSLVSERFVLTAAHCTEGGTLGKAKWVRVGELDLSTRKDDARPQDKDIVERVRHPEYKEPAVYNDIALLKLESDVTFNEWVSPICLHTSTSLPSRPVTVAGWGRLDFASNTSPMLLEVEITLFNKSECTRLMGHMKDKMLLPRGVDTDTMICAGDIRGGKDACSGDSGGPLFYEESECLTTQVGITSLGKDCGLPNTAGIYTNVNKYIPWIESIVWPDED